MSTAKIQPAQTFDCLTVLVGFQLLLEPFPQQLADRRRSAAIGVLATVLEVLNSDGQGTGERPSTRKPQPTTLQHKLTEKSPGKGVVSPTLLRTEGSRAPTTFFRGSPTGVPHT